MPAFITELDNPLGPLHKCVSDKLINEVALGLPCRTQAKLVRYQLKRTFLRAGPWQLLFWVNYNIILIKFDHSEQDLAFY